MYRMKKRGNTRSKVDGRYADSSGLNNTKLWWTNILLTSRSRKISVAKNGASVEGYAAGNIKGFI